MEEPALREASIRLPPGPATPAAIQLLRYSLRPLELLESLERRYGPAFTLRLAGFRPFVVLSDPSAVRDVFRGDPESLHSGAGNEFLAVTVGPNSVLVLDEELHARQRRILLAPMRGERMRSYSSVIARAVSEELDRWTTGGVLPLDAAMRRITLRVILEIALGTMPTAQREELARGFERMLAHGRTRFALILIQAVPTRLFEGSRFWPYFRDVRRLDALLRGAVEARRRGAETNPSGSVLADLLAARHEDGALLTEAEIRDALVTMVIAGYETTSVALAWAFSEILPRADVVQRIRDEADDVSDALAAGIGEAGARLEALPYLDATIRESLRLRTILAFVVRLTKRPFVAGGREYPAGVLLSPSNHLVHHRPDLYADPAEFRPQRFLERKYAAHEWFPFGGGNRACLGMGFAVHEMKVVITMVLRRVDLARASRRPSRPLRRGLTLVPHDGVPVVVNRRVYPGARR